MYLHLHFWRLSQHYSCLFYMSACAACLIATTQAHFVFYPVSLHSHSTAAMAAPSTADATMGDATTPDTGGGCHYGLQRPWNSTTSNLQGLQLPLQPGNTVYYNPTTVMDQLHITEHQTTTTPPLPDNTPYTQFFTALALEEYQLLSHQQATPLAQLDYTQPIYCIPGDLRMPHYNSTLLSVSLPTCTTTIRLPFTLQPATTTTTSSSNCRLNNHYS